jgi:serine/threonine protein kinase
MADKKASGELSPEAKKISDATVIGKIIVEQGLADSSEVRSSINRWQGLGKDASDDSLIQVLIDDGIATSHQLDKVRSQAEQQRSVQQIPGYQLLDKLGAGAMAVVFKAKQLSLDREVALKVLPKKFMTDPQFVDRFYAEGRAAAKLNHPNIVQAIDVGHAGDFHYFVMEFVEGYTVFDRIDQKGPYGEAEAIRVVTQISEALQHAQEKGLIHRDVKPRNIMIANTGIAKLADMGLARQVDDDEMAQVERGKAVGTPYYISPEQIRGLGDVDYRADIYGLGATFYHMIVGRVPFEGANPSAVMHKHLKEELVPPDHIREDISSGICEVIELMMAKDRNQRYKDWSDVLEDLNAISHGETPMYAQRTAVDLSGMGEAIEGGSDGRGGGATLVEANQFAAGPTMLEQPMFWLAAGSVLLNAIFLVFLVIAIVNS